MIWAPRLPAPDPPPPPPTTAYRWIRVGEDYRYSPRAGTGLDDRRGESCTVRVIGRGSGPRNCLVEFADGVMVVCNWGVLVKHRR
jgi:hypothetical protein